MDQIFDIAVIGAGSAGLVVATSANRLGLKTILIEKNKIGGECTHYGCVPSKALIHTAKTYKSFQQAETLGLPSVTTQPLDFAAVMQGVDEVVQGIYQHETPDVFEKQGITVLVDPLGARFLDATRLQVGSKIIQAKFIVICTGSSPRQLQIPGSEKVPFLHNENFWELRKMPTSLCFIGGGVIAAELGQAMHRLGSKITIVDLSNRILQVVDSEIADFLIRDFEKDGIEMVTNVKPKRFDLEAGEPILVVETGGLEQKIKASHYFSAIGRTPHVWGMDLEKAGVVFDDKGIKTNEYLQSSAPNIYACGDVTAAQKFTHTASHQANVVLHNILHQNNKKDDLSLLPWAIFTDPEIAHIGLSEQDAQLKFGDGIQVFRVNASIDRYLTDRNAVGLLKVIFDDKDQVVGADAIGQHAGEWIQLITLAIKNKISAQDMADTIFAYPTYSEIVKKAFTRFLRTKLKPVQLTD